MNRTLNLGQIANNSRASNSQRRNSEPLTIGAGANIDFTQGNEFLGRSRANRVLHSRSATIGEGSAIAATTNVNNIL
jgi:hypothetical protein